MMRMRKWQDDEISREGDDVLNGQMTTSTVEPRSSLSSFLTLDIPYSLILTLPEFGPATYFVSKWTSLDLPLRIMARSMIYRTRSPIAFRSLFVSSSLFGLERLLSFQ